MMMIRFPVVGLGLGLSMFASVLTASAARAQSEGRETSYVSRAKNPQRDHGTFVLAGAVGRADYKLNGQPFATARLHLYLTRESESSPLVHYAIYEEEGLARLWAFQIDWASHGDNVIYVNESGKWWDTKEWKFYDLSYRYAEGAPAVVSETVAVSTPVTVSAPVTVPVARPVSYWHHGWGCCWWCWWCWCL
jgi:hypothetical protein